MHSTVRTIAPKLRGMRAASTSKNETVSGVARRSRRTAIGRTATAVVQDRVASVTRIGSAPVYNLTVEGAHEYFANGLLVHNCDVLAWAVLSLDEYGLSGPLAVNYDEQAAESEYSDWDNKPSVFGFGTKRDHGLTGWGGRLSQFGRG